VAGVAEGPGAEMRLGGRPQADRCGGAGATPSPCERDDDSPCLPTTHRVNPSLPSNFVGQSRTLI
jgi:hypothetical protein